MLPSAIIEQIDLPLELRDDYQLSILREDLAHLYEDFSSAEISGNKWRKLRFNLDEASKQGKKKIVTFGGAYSNHLVATAAACKEFDFESIGIVRGGPFDKLNPSLDRAIAFGMKIEYWDRERYRHKNEEKVLQTLQERYPDGFIIPEGGSNELGVLGCEDIIKEQAKSFQVVICPVGTGATLAGIINGMQWHQHAIGISALKGAFDIEDQVKTWLNGSGKSWSLSHDYHFGGYARLNGELIEFINSFKRLNNIQLDPVYTGKMAFAAMDLMRKGKILKGSKVLLVHTGGQQGIAGMNMHLKRKGLKTIEV